MNVQRQRDSKRRCLSLWLLAAISVGLVGSLFWPGRQTSPLKVIAVSGGGAEHDAPSRSQNVQDAQSVSSTDKSPDTRNLAPPKLTVAEKAAISERMANAKHLLDALDARNAKREMDHRSDAHHVIAVRIDAPTVEQLTQIYDFLSRTSKDFSEGSEAEAEFRKQAAAFLSEVGSSDFRVVVKSTDIVTGVADFRSIRARVRSVAVKYRDGSIEITGPHPTTVFENPPSEMPNLFPEP